MQISFEFEGGDHMKQLLKTYYEFSDYQIAQLEYLFKTILSEISKMLLMGILFRHELDLYIISLLALCFLRTSTGGLHCKTYLTCLLSSMLFMIIAIRILPLIPVLPVIKITLLLPCIIINYWVGPVTSDVHLPLTEDIIRSGRLRATFLVILFIVTMLIISESKYTISIFWIIIIHTLQLVIAKIRKKGANRI